MLKWLSILVRNFSGVNIGRKLFNAFICLFDLRAKLRVWRQRRIAEPIVANHSLLIGIGDRARFELAHGRDGFLGMLPFLTGTSSEATSYSGLGIPTSQWSNHPTMFCNRSTRCQG